jgi:TRAP-type C4-dicarboxylate transport system permease small subunit
MRLLIVVVLVVILILSWPSWRHRNRDPGYVAPAWHRNYDYAPTGIIGVLLILAVILILLGVI